MQENSGWTRRPPVYCFNINSKTQDDIVETKTRVRKESRYLNKCTNGPEALRIDALPPLHIGSNDQAKPKNSFFARAVAEGQRVLLGPGCDSAKTGGHHLSDRFWVSGDGQVVPLPQGFGVLHLETRDIGQGFHARFKDTVVREHLADHANLLPTAEMAE